MHNLNPTARGALFIVSAEFMFACMGAGIHALAGEMPNSMVVFARNLVALVLLLPLFMHGNNIGLRTAHPYLHLFRGLTGLAAMYCFFYAIAHLTLANAMLLKLSAPLFIPLVALFWLGERFTWLVVVALALGFSGVIVVLSPHAQALSPAAFIALLGGLLAAIAKTSVRKLSRTEPTARIIFYFSLTGVVFSLLPAVWEWQAIDGRQAALLLAIGLFATAGQFMLTRGMAATEAAKVAPFTYFSVIFAAALGWLFWREPVTLGTWLGSLLVLSGGVIIARDAARRKRATAQSTTPVTATAAEGKA